VFFFLSEHSVVTITGEARIDEKGERFQGGTGKSGVRGLICLGPGFNKPVE